MMARRRLTPTGQARAPDSSPQKADTNGLPENALRSGMYSAPIARVAGDAAGAAALAEMAHTLETARVTGRMVLDLVLDDIAADHLTRDRIPADDEDMAALRESLLQHGQRTPIEVTPIEGALPYGLISGWRRLNALKALHAETQDLRFATIRALVRQPETAADAYISMVEENEVRVGLSQYERARVAARATQRGIFESEKKALLALFASASRAKRSRIRAFLEIYHTLDDVLRFPAHLPERLGLDLVDMVRNGQADQIRADLRQCDPGTPEAELSALGKIVTKARHQPPQRPAPSGTEILSQVTCTQTLHGKTLTLKFRGKGVTPELARQIHDLLGGLRSGD